MHRDRRGRQTEATAERVGADGLKGGDERRRRASAFGGRGQQRLGGGEKAGEREQRKVRGESSWGELI